MAALALDVNAIRARFSSLRSEWALFDGPGGTQTPDSVIDAIAAYLRESNANLGGAFEASVRSDALVTNARLAAASFLGCTSDEIVFGAEHDDAQLRALANASAESSAPATRSSRRGSTTTATSRRGSSSRATSI